MFYNSIEKIFSDSEFFRYLSKILEDKESRVLFHNLNTSSKALIAAFIYKKTQKNIIFVSSDDKQAEDVVDDFDLLVGKESSFFLPDFEVLPYEERSPHYTIRAQRIDTLVKAISSDKAIYSLSIGALMRKIVPSDIFKKNIIKLEVGADYLPDVLVSNLVGMGYDVQYQVSHVCQVARRGGIIDVFAPNYSYPIRIEFFGDTIDTIRFFSVGSQISTNRNLSECVLIPAREFSIHDIQTRNENIWEKIHEKNFYEGIEQDISLLFDNLTNFTGYLNDAIFIWNDWQFLKPKIKEIIDETLHLWKKSNRKNIPKPEMIFETEKHILGLIKNHKNLFLSLGEFISQDFTSSVKAPFETLLSFGSSLELLEQDLIKRHNDNYTIFIQSDNQSQSKRLKELLDDLEFGINYTIGVFQKGFILQDCKLIIYTDHEIFSRYKRRRRSAHFSQKEAIIDYDSIKPGDYIVHITHGIGIFHGLKKIKIDGSLVECLILAYAGNDKVYVPTEQLRLVSKYVAQEGIAPVIHKLGSKKWLQIKNRAKKQIELVAEDLVQLYAKRRLQKGIKFDKDTLWQEEMETSFIYEDTPDQKQTASEIKKDMESDYPMERLLCGDVGFGKTEVAIRAAFKSVMSGYQVAILVPTTLLAEQHFIVFKERMSAYPIKIAMFSRFVSKGNLLKSVELIRRGEVDIAIGTHRLLSKDIKFKKLGLLIIDEEHRFGVRHKDKLRQLKSNVDTLYMSATPIPRTMNMALSKLKEMSLIQTSPVARLPIRSIMIPFDEQIIRDAIKREIARGGQVFFVHNRVQTIETIADKLRNLMPKVRFAIGHGQLPEKQLEKIMLDFSHHKFDVLIASTIIESGIDIPNANTIIINQSDRFGLAQLYQIRGRVGRSNKRAYAYFIIQKGMTDIARKRLETLLEYESLGSGYQIAMRDLEIRGAGTLLGTKQSGIINSIGFNYYSKLLNEAVENFEKNPQQLWDKEDESVYVKTGEDRFIPSNFISDDKERLKIYRRMSSFESPEEFDKLQDELRDRFGKLPDEVATTIKHFKIRFFSAKLNLKSFKIRNDEAILEFLNKNLPKQSLIAQLLNKFDYPVRFDTSSNLKIFFNLKDKTNKTDIGINVLNFLFVKSVKD